LRKFDGLHSRKLPFGLAAAIWASRMTLMRDKLDFGVYSFNVCISNSGIASKVVLRKSVIQSEKEPLF